jgi:hypothetical protein
MYIFINKKVMKKFFNQLFCDNNSINEKSVVGVMAFIMMSLFACADIVTVFLGKPLVINEFIFNSFLILVLGSFAIGSVDKFVHKKHGSDDSETPSNEEVVN